MFNFKKGLMVGCIAGGTACLLHFAFCVLIYGSTAARGFSYSGGIVSALQTWGLHWRAIGALFGMVTLMFGILAATRPEIKRKRGRANHEPEER